MYNQKQILQLHDQKMIKIMWVKNYLRLISQKIIYGWKGERENWITLYNELSLNEMGDIKLP